eukprot:gene31313-39353_t
MPEVTDVTVTEILNDLVVSIVEDSVVSSESSGGRYTRLQSAVVMISPVALLLAANVSISIPFIVTPEPNSTVRVLHAPMNVSRSMVWTELEAPSVLKPAAGGRLGLATTRINRFGILVVVGLHHCQDGNFDEGVETDVDCGVMCPAACLNTQRCRSNQECCSENCVTRNAETPMDKTCGAVMDTSELECQASNEVSSSVEAGRTKLEEAQKEGEPSALLLSSRQATAETSQIAITELVVTETVTSAEAMCTADTGALSITRNNLTDADLQSPP